MKIIDIHSHCNIGSKFDCSETDMHKRNLPFMLQDYDNSGINVGAFSPYSSVLENAESGIYADNEYFFQFAKTNERVYQWLVLDPRQEKLFAQIRKMIDGDKVLGIKIHSVYHNYDIDEYADKIFSFADELGCFVLMHPDKVSNMVKYADRYPNMKLIIAHLGGRESFLEAIENAKHGNIFTDTSGGGVCLNNIIEYAVERVGSEKIFFGTDTYACGYEVGRLQFARISEKDKENIFYKNAKKHFKRQFKNL
jgi:predicted TIM-barrel fold metal-dependent hydrolase